MEETISRYRKDNINYLKNCFAKLEKDIEGRIPHNGILVLKILTELEDIKNYLEIGVHNGGSMGLVISSEKIEKATGIDLFEDMYNVKKHLNRDKYIRYQYFRRDNLKKEKTLKSLRRINKNVEINLVQGNSYFDETEKKIEKLLENESVDLLFIDGDHTLDGVKNDFQRYSKFVRKGGFIVFDDYHHKEIKKFVDNLLSEDKNLEKILIFESSNGGALDILLRVKTI